MNFKKFLLFLNFGIFAESFSKLSENKFIHLLEMDGIEGLIMRVWTKNRNVWELLKSFGEFHQISIRKLIFWWDFAKISRKPQNYTAI